MSWSLQAGSTTGHFHITFLQNLLQMFFCWGLQKMLHWRYKICWLVLDVSSRLGEVAQTWFYGDGQCLKSTMLFLTRRFPFRYVQPWVISQSRTTDQLLFAVTQELVTIESSHHLIVPVAGSSHMHTGPSLTLCTTHRADIAMVVSLALCCGLAPYFLFQSHSKYPCWHIAEHYVTLS